MGKKTLYLFLAFGFIWFFINLNNIGQLFVVLTKRWSARAQLRMIGLHGPVMANKHCRYPFTPPCPSSKDVRSLLCPKKSTKDFYCSAFVEQKFEKSSRKQNGSSHLESFLFVPLVFVGAKCNFVTGIPRCAHIHTALHSPHFLFPCRPSSPVKEPWFHMLNHFPECFKMSDPSDPFRACRSRWRWY